jgi:hypothetical protein
MMADILERPMHRRSFLKLTALGAAGLYLDLRALVPRPAEAGPPAILHRPPMVPRYR